MVIAILLTILIAAFSKAVMDVLNFHYGESLFVKAKNKFFWDPLLSHLNKYKNGDPTQGPRFFGSTTFFVWTTDAWHLFQMINSLFYTVAVTLGYVKFGILGVIIVWVSTKLWFELSYRMLYTKG